MTPGFADTVFSYMFILENCYVLTLYSNVTFVCNGTGMFSLLSTYYSKWMLLKRYKEIPCYNGAYNTAWSGRSLEREAHGDVE